MKNQILLIFARAHTHTRTHVSKHTRYRKPCVLTLREKRKKARERERETGEEGVRDIMKLFSSIFFFLLLCVGVKSTPFNACPQCDVIGGVTPSCPGLITLPFSSRSTNISIQLWVSRQGGFSSGLYFYPILETTPTPAPSSLFSIAISRYEFIEFYDEPRVDFFTNISALYDVGGLCETIQSTQFSINETTDYRSSIEQLGTGMFKLLLTFESGLFNYYLASNGTHYTKSLPDSFFYGVFPVRFNIRPSFRLLCPWTFHKLIIHPRIFSTQEAIALLT